MYDRYEEAKKLLRNEASELFTEIPKESMVSFTEMYSRSLQVMREKSIHAIVIEGYHFIDYGKDDDIRNIAKSLKELATRLDVPVIVNDKLKRQQHHKHRNNKLQRNKHFEVFK